MKKVTCDTTSCFLCQSCMPEWRGLIGLHKQTQVYKKGAQLFAEGDEVTGIFFTLYGAVKVHKQWGDQKELILRFAAGNDIIGFRGLGGATTTYPVSATVLEPTKACFIPNGFLEDSLKANPGLTYRLLQFFATELQQAEQRMSDLAHMDVKGRIARALLELKTVFHTDETGFINLTISRQDIASYAGTIYETVFKVFTEWINAKLITTEGKRIKILSERKLQALVH